MKSLNDLILKLDGTPDEDLVSEARRELLVSRSWKTLIREYLIECGPIDFRLRARAGEVARVMPMSFVLYSDPAERFSVVLNKFDRVLHDQFLREGKLAPHSHHCAFVTRLLKGSYLQWIYAPSEKSNTQSVVKFVRCEAGSVYDMSPEMVHLVAAPDDKTLSLLVRGRPVRTPYHDVQTGGFEDHEIDCEGEEILRLLEGPDPPVSGALIELSKHSQAA